MYADAAPLPPRHVLAPDLAALLPRKARTFTLAARFLPAPQREATVVLYAFCRVMDDLVDEPPADLTRDAIRSQIGEWRRWLASPGLASPEPVGLADALRDVIDAHDLPTVYLSQLLDGLETDLGAVEMPDFPTLRRYCFLVAGTVGLAMSHLMGARQPEARAAAAELGVAMQLTNVLRDLGADLRAGRCYLPADEFGCYGFSPKRLRALAVQRQPNDQFRALMRFQITRARGYYARGLAGVWLLPPEARPAILIAGRLYRAILATIEGNGYDVLDRRAVVSRLTKGYETLAALMLVRLWGNGVVPAALSSPAERLAELSL